MLVLQRPCLPSEPRKNNNIPGGAILTPKFHLRIPRAAFERYLRIKYFWDINSYPKNWVRLARRYGDVRQVRTVGTATMRVRVRVRYVGTVRKYGVLV